MNKNFDKLYSVDSTGNIRVWWVEQKNNEYRTHSGVLNGQIVTTEFTVCNSKNLGKKNETSSVDQCTKECQALIKKKLKSGYHENENDAAKGTSYVEPMLAETLHKLTVPPNYESGKWGLQCKFNGNRCIATKDGLFTRKGEKYISVPHIENQLREFFVLYPDAVLDGELFNNDLRQQLNEISKLIRKTKKISPEDFEKSRQLVKFYVYDGYGFGMSGDILEENAPYIERKNWIDKNVIPHHSYLVSVETTVVRSENEMLTKFQALLDDQQEGGILRNLDAGYEHKRSKNLVKVKIDEDDEGEIIDITDGDGNWKGAAVNVTLKWKDKVFDGVFIGKYDIRAEILRNKKQWIGKTVTFLYMGLTGLGTPNYVRIDPDNCFKSDR